jgi:hypothetical protein
MTATQLPARPWMVQSCERVPRRSRPEAQPTGPFVPLATRVPRSLRQRVRLVCVELARHVLDFVADAIRERLLRRLSR